MDKEQNIKTQGIGNCNTGTHLKRLYIVNEVKRFIFELLLRAAAVEKKKNQKIIKIFEKQK